MKIQLATSILLLLLLLLLLSLSTYALTSSSSGSKHTWKKGNLFKSPPEPHNLSRHELLHVATCVSAGIVSSTFILPFEASNARGRATLEYSCDRYYPRLEAGGNFYANDLKRAIEKNDWAAIKASFPLHLS